MITPQHFFEDFETLQYYGKFQKNINLQLSQKLLDIECNRLSMITAQFRKISKVCITPKVRDRPKLINKYLLWECIVFVKGTKTG